MGNCAVSKKPTGVFSNIFLQVESLIQYNDLRSLQFVSQTVEFKDNFTDLNKNYFVQDNIKHNLLSLSVFNAATDCFKYILNALGADLDKTEKLLSTQGTTLVELACTRGNTELLEAYLPYFKSVPREVPAEESSMSIFLTGKSEKNEFVAKGFLTPIQKACEQGNINIVASIFKFYKEKKPVPYELDVNYRDDLMGENCAFVACRSGNYAMIRFLHQICHCNFRILNKLGENAIQVMAAANGKKPNKDFHECLVFLVNHVGVDALYNYEETLLLITCDRSITFIEKKLEGKGVKIDKEEIDERNKILKERRVKSMMEQKLDMVEGKNFNFCSMYAECMDDESDQLSVISSLKRDTLFDSVASEMPPNF